MRRMDAAARWVPLVTAAMLASCASWQPKDRDPQSFSEVGSIQAAVVAVAPFEVLVKNLRPAFDLKPADAFSQALQVTGSSSNVQDRATSLTLQAALAGTLTSSESKDASSTVDGKTTESSSSSTTSSRSPPNAASVPKADVPTAASASPAAVAALTGHNAMLRYQLATALLQEVAMLNAYVNDAPRLAGYDPFVVRVQVAVHPRARHTPYDAMVDLRFGGSNRGGSATTCAHDAEDGGVPGEVIAVPLMMSDAIDASSVSAMQRNLAQLSLAVSAMKGPLGLMGGYGYRAENIVASLGWEYVSISSVSRKDECTLTVRMPALPAGYDRYDMVPRTHNVTALLLVKRPQRPWSESPCWNDAQRECRTVRMTSSPEFRHATDAGRWFGPSEPPNGVGRRSGPHVAEAPTPAQDFTVYFLADPVVPPPQRAVLKIQGKKQPYEATLTLRGGLHLTRRSFNNATLWPDGGTAEANGLWADEVGIDDARRVLTLKFTGVTEAALKPFKLSPAASAPAPDSSATQAPSVHRLNARQASTEAKGSTPASKVSSASKTDDTGSTKGAADDRDRGVRWTLDLAPGSDLCSQTDPSKRRCSPASLQIVLQGEVLVDEAEKGDEKPRAKLTLPQQIEVGADGTATLPVAVEFGKEGPKTASLTLSPALFGAPVMRGKATACARLSDKPTVVEIVESCNFDLPLRGVPVPSLLRAQQGTLSLKLTEQLAGKDGKGAEDGATSTGEVVLLRSPGTTVKVDERGLR